LPKNLSRLVLKGVIGFLIGLAVWGGLSVPYTRLLASLTETVVRLDERPPVTYITPNGTLMMVDRSDFPPSPSSVRLGVESTDITFNLILLMTLFAASGRALSDRNVFGFAGAAVVLVFVRRGLLRSELRTLEHIALWLRRAALLGRGALLLQRGRSLRFRGRALVAISSLFAVDSEATCSGATNSARIPARTCLRDER
jgi:hypothetical protein